MDQSIEYGVNMSRKIDEVITQDEQVAGERAAEEQLNAGEQEVTEDAEEE